MMSYFNQYPNTAPSPHSPYLQQHQHLQLQQQIAQQQNGYSSMSNGANLNIKSESPETMQNFMENNTAAAAAIALQNPNNFQHLIRNSMYCPIKDSAVSLIGSAPSPSQAAAATAAAALSMSMGYVPSAAATAAMWTSTTGSTVSLNLDTQSQINSQLQHSVM